MTWWSTTFPVATLSSAYAGLAFLTGSNNYLMLAIALVLTSSVFSVGAVLATVNAGWRSLHDPD